MIMEYTSIQEAMDKGEGKVAIRGWVFRERGSNKLKFIVLRDSTNMIQCVIDKAAVGDERFTDADKLQVEASVEVKGEMKKEPRAPTGYEVHVTEFNVVGWCDKFPIRSDQNREFLDDNRHLTLRTQRMTSILKIRSTYFQVREQFFQEKGFYRFDPPILQPSQCEGGSTLFAVKYYEGETYLSQSWQLYAEAAVYALENIYDAAPTFRAEKSKTSRHLSEFWMVETECAWKDLHAISELAKEELKHCIAKVIERHEEDLKSLGQDVEKLKKMVSAEWPTIKYRDVLRILKEKKKMDVPFGKDLRTIEEEKVMEEFDTPVVVTHYPVDVMAFYKPRDPEHPDEALCFDMLAPEGYGEIVGGSQRSMDIDDMKKRLEAEGEDASNYDWYFDLRKYGGVPHSGYGIGAERVIAWICKLDTIKDAIPFPRTMLRWKP
ncbi:asparagine--tRNA ligase [Candidatus Woesearchaeota archaeon]|nr:asparagine--tRNA ligase [Candidatus Woesearchaeota archaeon]